MFDDSDRIVLHNRIFDTKDFLVRILDLNNLFHKRCQIQFNYTDGML